jgi:hypothetical protein
MKLHALPKKEGFFSPSSFAAMGLISVSMTKQKMKIMLVNPPNYGRDCGRLGTI